MNYELAKQLKDAGFPEQTRWGIEHNVHRYKTMDVDAVSYPELGELIDELINSDELEFSEFILKYEDDVWEAIDGSCEGTWYHTGSGLTPEEAVAKLWLELNKKK